ncbi:MAG: hypothetical protein V1746_08440 [bacterium]
MKKTFIFFGAIALSLFISSAMVSAACGTCDKDKKDEKKASSPIVAAAAAAKPTETDEQEAETDKGDPSDPEVKKQRQGMEEDNMDKETPAE